MTGKRILAVDDEPNIVQLIKVNLERAGYEVDIACDGEQALEMLRQSRFDMVISDVMMPNMNGFDLLENIRRNPVTTALPVIMLTANAEDADVTRGYMSGTDVYLTKPFRPMELISWVNRVMSGLDNDAGAANLKL